MQYLLIKVRHGHYVTCIRRPDTSLRLIQHPYCLHIIVPIYILNDYNVKLINSTNLYIFDLFFLLISRYISNTAAILRSLFSSEFIGYIVCWVAKLNAALRLDSETKNNKILNISCPRSRIEVKTSRVYSHTFKPLHHDWLHLYYINVILFLYLYEASRSAASQRVTVNLTGCGFDPHSKRWNINLNLYFHFFALVTNTQCLYNPAESG